MSRSNTYKYRNSFIVRNPSHTKLNNIFSVNQLSKTNAALVWHFMSELYYYYYLYKGDFQPFRWFISVLCQSYFRCILVHLRLFFLNRWDFLDGIKIYFLLLLFFEIECTFFSASNWRIRKTVEQSNFWAK